MSGDDEIIFEPLLSYRISHRRRSAVSSPLQQLSCTDRVSQSKSGAGALLAFSLFLRFLDRCLTQ